MKKSNSISNKMHKISVGISNADNDPQIKEILTPFGYGTEGLAKGKALYDNVHEILVEKEESKESKESVIDEVSELHNKAFRLFKDAVGVAKVVFKNDSLKISKLRLNESVERATSKLIEHSKHFYFTILNDDAIIESMAERSYTEEKLKTELEVIKEFETKNNERLLKGVDSTVTTEKKDEQVELLKSWYADFRDIARIALRDYPKLLKKLMLD